MKSFKGTEHSDHIQVLVAFAVSVRKGSSRYEFKRWAGRDSNPKGTLSVPGCAQVIGLAQILVWPFTRLQYLLGIMFTSLLFGLAGAFVMLIGAFLIIGSLHLSLFGALTAFSVIAVGSIFFGSLMLLISGLVKSNNAYNSIQILVIFVVNFASTVFYSFSSSLPLPIQALFYVNPLTYIANTARGGFVGVLPAVAQWQVPLLIIETVVVLALATRVYVRSEVSFV